MRLSASVPVVVLTYPLCPLPVPSAAPQMSIASISPTDIRLSWTPLSAVQSRGVVTGYRIEYSALDPGTLPFTPSGTQTDLHALT